MPNENLSSPIKPTDKTASSSMPKHRTSYYITRTKQLKRSPLQSCTSAEDLERLFTNLALKTEKDMNAPSTPAENSVFTPPLVIQETASYPSAPQPFPLLFSNAATDPNLSPTPKLLTIGLLDQTNVQDLSAMDKHNERPDLKRKSTGAIFSASNYDSEDEDAHHVNKKISHSIKF